MLCAIKLKSDSEWCCNHLCNLKSQNILNEYFNKGLRLCWNLTYRCDFATRVLRWRYWCRQSFVFTQRQYLDYATTVQWSFYCLEPTALNWPNADVRPGGQVLTLMREGHWLQTQIFYVSCYFYHVWLWKHGNMHAQ